MSTIKGESKKTSDLFLWISRLPRGLETAFHSFFNSPFRVDFKNVHFIIFGEILTEILAKYYRDIILSSFFCSVLKEVLKHS